jgi:hypothetical protein
MRWTRDAMSKVLLASVDATLSIPTVVQQAIKIGVDFGIALLPTYLCQELLSDKKEAKTAGSVK